MTSETPDLLPAAIVDGKPMFYIETIEAPESAKWSPTRSARETPLTDSLEKVGESVTAVCKQFGGRLQEERRGMGPDEVTVEFGIALSGSVGVVLTKMTTDASLKVTATWRREAVDENDEG